MTRLHCFLIGLLLSLSTTCWAQGAGLQRIAIPDHSGFDRPMAAFTVDVPSGWRAEGSVLWGANASCESVVPSIQWRAQSADGAMVFEILPRWASQIPGAIQPTLRGCPTMPFTSIRAFLEYLATQRHPSAQLLDYRERADMRDQVRVPPAAQVPAGLPMQLRNWAEAGEILIGWSENGRAMRESISASGIFMESRVQMPTLGHDHSLALITNPPTVLRTPDGALDLNLAERIRSSIQATAEWQAQMNGHQAAMSGIAMRGASTRAGIAAQTASEIADINHEAWRKRQASEGSMHTQTINAIRGVQPYVDSQSTTGTVELDNRYDHSWRLQDGNYIQTNDPNFNPYLDTGVDGEELERYDP